MAAGIKPTSPVSNNAMAGPLTMLRAATEQDSVRGVVLLTAPAR